MLDWSGVIVVASKKKKNMSDFYTLDIYRPRRQPRDVPVHLLQFLTLGHTGFWEQEEKNNNFIWTFCWFPLVPISTSIYNGAIWILSFPSRLNGHTVDMWTKIKVKKRPYEIYVLYLCLSLYLHSVCVRMRACTNLLLLRSSVSRLGHQGEA